MTLSLTQLVGELRRLAEFDRSWVAAAAALSYAGRQEPPANFNTQLDPRYDTAPPPHGAFRRGFLR